ncbi:MAG: exonuclease domain-containing protein [Prevotella sp.]|nr:exonuclease domain-containing protein [Alistipes senegalensis]MCM1357299.1 exonuclease domain-containing protein [Prevotella sp.]MCM1473124.1 exonuclease domain-containing protein [Muribaculaceae bacterium]MDE6426988.1 exonuclease domain-containing protein [Ruminococcus sp.]
MESTEKKYLCFADFEFTCGYCIHKLDSEILSSGVVICDENYEVKEQFYCTSRPNRYPKMTKQCKKLTKLTQEEINNAPDSNDVMNIILRLVRKYNIDKIYVWGNFDRTGLSSDARQHQRFGKACANIQRVGKRICDIQQGITEKLELPEPVNIKELASAFDYQPLSGSFHNALNDALALYVIYKRVYTEDLSGNEKLAEIRRLRIEKIEKRRQEVEKKQKETAFSVPLTDMEKLYYSNIDENSDEAKNFIYLRSKFASSMKNNPEKNDFLLLYMKTPEKFKVIPKEKYNRTLQGLSTKAIDFGRENFSDLILRECMNYNSVKLKI